MTTIDREQFVDGRAARWQRLEQLLSKGPGSGEEWGEFAAAYRCVCADLAVARSAALPADVQDYLDELAGRAHNQLYGVRPVNLGRSILRDVLSGFPRELRANLAFFVLASLLFYGPFALGALGAWFDPTFAGRVLSPDQLAEMESAYSGDLVRGASADAGMAGFYVFNNVGIAFRVFATGALFGVGSIFYLVYNGLVIGTVFGYLGSVGLAGNLLAFTSGHSAWELTAICVSGSAGLRLGWTLLVPSGRTRLGALRAARMSLYRLILGAAFMLTIAAAIEGFWSAGPVPPAGKFVFGAIQIGIVAGWLTLGGRRDP
ncbi:MAG: stage II sporulation protein M [Myxococcota bacterium]